MYDDRHGFFMDDPGPYHTKDSFEWAMSTLGDLVGLRVYYDPSQGPKDYEIDLGGSGDFHQNSVHRGLSDWEAQSFPHTEFTPLDNLAMFGWEQFEAKEGVGSFRAAGVPLNVNDAAKYLGWPLHAIGDATVPMHVTNTAGWGHRPYEDAINYLMTDPSATPLLSTNDPVAQSNNIADILNRALVWRNLILSWRAAHPSAPNEVPIRDFITSIASKTFQSAIANEAVIFDSSASLSWVLASDSATAAYETPAREAVMLDLMKDGIAAQIAFLTSSMEVLP